MISIESVSHGKVIFTFEYGKGLVAVHFVLFLSVTDCLCKYSLGHITLILQLIGGNNYFYSEKGQN